jgi:hypothetical protein
LNTFRGSVPVEVDGAVVGGLAKLRKLLTSESLPTVGRLEDMTDVSEFRRGRVAVLDVVDVGARAGLRRIDLMGC